MTDENNDTLNDDILIDYYIIPDWIQNDTINPNLFIYFDRSIYN